MSSNAGLVEVQERFGRGSGEVREKFVKEWTSYKEGKRTIRETTRNQKLVREHYAGNFDKIQNTKWNSWKYQQVHIISKFPRLQLGEYLMYNICNY